MNATSEDEKKGLWVKDRNQNSQPRRVVATPELLKDCHLYLYENTLICLTATNTEEAYDWGLAGFSIGLVDTVKEEQVCLVPFVKDLPPRVSPAGFIVSDIKIIKDLPA